MKVKLKFDQKAILELLAEHGEKIVLGGVALCFLFFLYRAIGWDRFGQTPDALIAEASKALAHIDQCETRVTKEIVDYKKRIDEISDPIPVKPFEFTTALNNPAIDPLGKRGEPVLYAVEDLRAASGVGCFGGPARAAERGGASDEPRGKRWAVLTGVVDLEKCRQSFRECFKNAARTTPEDLVPKFASFQVERAEVTDQGQNPSEPRWKRPYDDLKNVAERRESTGSRELVAAEFRDSVLTSPLPTRSDRDWNDEDQVVHPKLRAGERATTPGTPGQGERDGTYRGQSRLGDRRIDSKAENRAPYCLFRFFDYNVEPGKRYRYRVQICVDNPNFNVSPEYLSQEVRQRMTDKGWGPALKSGWSEPSNVVAVPRDNRLLVVSVKPATRSDGEPTGKIMAVHWDMQEGTEVAAESDVQRGKLVNFLGESLAASAASPAPAARAPKEGGGLLDIAKRRAGKEERGGADTKQPKAAKAKQPRPAPAAAAKKIDFETDMLVLDLRGGGALPGKNRDLNWPGEMLLLTPDGQLEVRGDVEDQNACLAQRSAAAGPGRPGAGR